MARTLFRLFRCEDSMSWEMLGLLLLGQLWGTFNSASTVHKRTRLKCISVINTQTHHWYREFRWFGP